MCLVRITDPGGAASSGDARRWPSCGGHLVDFAALRAIADPVVAEQVFGMAMEGRSGPTPCPRCDDPMQESVVRSVTIEACRRCDVVWLDPEEVDGFRGGLTDDHRNARRTASVSSMPEGTERLSRLIAWLFD